MKNELYHYGKGHDDNPPGRGSGRYPYGSSNNESSSPKQSNNSKDEKGESKVKKVLKRAWTAHKDHLKRQAEEDTEYEKRKAERKAKKEAERAQKAAEKRHKDVLAGKIDIKDMTASEFNSYLEVKMREKRLRDVMPKDIDGPKNAVTAMGPIFETMKVAAGYIKTVSDFKNSLNALASKAKSEPLQSENVAKKGLKDYAEGSLSLDQLQDIIKTANTLANAEKAAGLKKDKDKK